LLKVRADVADVSEHGSFGRFIVLFGRCTRKIWRCRGDMVDKTRKPVEEASFNVNSSIGYLNMIYIIFGNFKIFSIIVLLIGL
jgi:hypothetical protein